MLSRTASERNESQQGTHFRLSPMRVELKPLHMSVLRWKRLSFERWYSRTYNYENRSKRTRGCPPYVISGIRGKGSDQKLLSRMQSSLSLLQPRATTATCARFTEHERQSHRQAGGKLTLPLSEAVHCHHPRIQRDCRRPLFGVRACSPCVSSRRIKRGRFVGLRAGPWAMPRLLR
jgi:hypothetical protein